MIFNALHKLELSQNTQKLSQNTQKLSQNTLFFPFVEILFTFEETELLKQKKSSPTTTQKRKHSIMTRIKEVNILERISNSRYHNENLVGNQQGKNFLGECQVIDFQLFWKTNSNFLARISVLLNVTNPFRSFVREELQRTDIIDDMSNIYLYILRIPFKRAGARDNKIF